MLYLAPGSALAQNRSVQATGASKALATQYNMHQYWKMLQAMPFQTSVRNVFPATTYLYKHDTVDCIVLQPQGRLLVQKRG